MHIRQPEPITHPLLNYGVLVVSLLFDGSSWYVALHEFRVHKGRLGYFEGLRRSNDPSMCAFVQNIVHHRHRI